MSDSNLPPEQPRFRHGHQSKNVCIPGEDPASLDALRANLLAEHQPATVTEELLVDEMAQHYWTIRRYRYFQSSMWAASQRNAEGQLVVDSNRLLRILENGVAALYQRAQAAAERGYYRALHTLRQLEQERGFVPRAAVAVAHAAAVSESLPAPIHVSGFIPKKVRRAPAAGFPTGLPTGKLLRDLQATVGMTREQIYAALAPPNYNSSDS